VQVTFTYLLSRSQIEHNQCFVSADVFIPGAQVLGELPVVIHQKVLGMKTRNSAPSCCIRSSSAIAVPSSVGAHDFHFGSLGFSSYSVPVKLSVKTDYATRAVLGLAQHYPEGLAVRVEALASEQRIPANYLVQILIELKAQGIARSVRGKEGGYLLARSPSEISLGDVLRAVHGQVFDTPALSDPQCPPELRRAWQRLQHTMQAAADAITFQQLLDENVAKEKMYYI
jgi:Rrf2 family transcriptional regulator, cysteine metabolism repressor